MPPPLEPSSGEQALAASACLRGRTGPIPGSREGAELVEQVAKSNGHQLPERRRRDVHRAGALDAVPCPGRTSTRSRTGRSWLLVYLLGAARAATPECPSRAPPCAGV